MKNDFPIMPLRAMYADKSTEGKDLNKIGNIEPITIPNNLFDRPTLEKAIEAGAFIYDGFTYYISHVTRTGDGVDMYASATLDDEFVARVINVYTEDDPDTITVESYNRTIPASSGVHLYRHNITIRIDGVTNYATFNVTLITSSDKQLDTLQKVFSANSNKRMQATGFYNSNSGGGNVTLLAYIQSNYYVYFNRGNSTDSAQFADDEHCTASDSIVQIA